MSDESSTSFVERPSQFRIITVFGSAESTARSLFSKETVSNQSTKVDAWWKMCSASEATEPKPRTTESATVISSILYTAAP